MNIGAVKIPRNILRKKDVGIQVLKKVKKKGQKNVEKEREEQQSDSFMGFYFSIYVCNIKCVYNYVYCICTLPINEEDEKKKKKQEILV